MSTSPSLSSLRLKIFTQDSAFFLTYFAEVELMPKTITIRTYLVPEDVNAAQERFAPHSISQIINALLRLSIKRPEWVIEELSKAPKSTYRGISHG